MSQIVRNLRSIREECNQLMKKRIKKIKRKNQYTKAYTFEEDEKLRQHNYLTLIVQQIPKKIANNNVFRLKTNIQFTLDINNDHSLGSLGVDPHSNNYKIARSDRRKNVIIFTLHQIDRPITPSDVLHSIFLEKNKHLAECFLQFDKRNLDPTQFKLSTLEQMTEFEKQLVGKPYSCYVNIYKDGIWKTFQKVFSQELLHLYAITEEMLIHYCNETNLIPFSAYIDPNDSQLSVFVKVFQGIVDQQKMKREYVNYNGERFYAYLQAKSFLFYDDVNDQYTEYQYCVTDCESRWISYERGKNNELDYFNMKQVLCSTEESSFQEPVMKRCGFKQKI